MSECGLFWVGGALFWVGGVVWALLSLGGGGWENILVGRGWVGVNGSGYTVR